MSAGCVDLNTRRSFVQFGYDPPNPGDFSAPAAREMDIFGVKRRHIRCLSHVWADASTSLPSIIDKCIVKLDFPQRLILVLFVRSIFYADTA